MHTFRNTPHCLKRDGAAYSPFVSSTMQRNHDKTITKANLWEEEGISGDCDRAKEQLHDNQAAPPTSRPSTRSLATANREVPKKDTGDEEPKAHATFDDMGLQEGLLRGIYAYGYEKPSAIQQRGIVPCCSGRDVIAQAQSGTGKTATFSVGIIEQLDLSKSYCQVRLHVTLVSRARPSRKAACA